MNYCEEKGISTSNLNEAQRTLYFIAENMKMTKSISEEGYEHFQQAIKALEQEPRKGHWIKTPKAVMGEGYMWYCDKCKHQVYQDSSKPYPSEKYCPNCGAKMEEMEK